MVSPALTGLEKLHQELVALIAELGEATARDVPDRSQLTGIRWRLSRASRARTRLIETILLPHLRVQASPRDSHALDTLQEQIATASAESSRHVGAWSIDRASADWAGYRAASSEMRQAMTRRIDAEKTLLYPLLQRSPIAPANGPVPLPETDAG
jgi:hypothetical protein